MHNSKNKSSLTNFLCKYVLNHFTFQDDEHSKKLYLSGGFDDGLLTKLMTISETSTEENITHEEADTRMIYHALAADAQYTNRNGCTVIRVDDTDVFALAVHFYPKMENTKELWIELGNLGKKENKKYLPIHTLCSTLNPITCKVLPAVHALTGCDTVSAFLGIGKKSVVKKLELEIARWQDLSLIGELNNNTEQNKKAEDIAEQFVIYLYQRDKKSYKSLGELRYTLATTKDTVMSKLPPSQPAFHQHFLRASWQTKVWMAANQASPNIPSPVKHGWELQDGHLSSVLFDGTTAAEAMDAFLCSCTKKNACA